MTNLFDFIIFTNNPLSAGLIIVGLKFTLKFLLGVSLSLKLSDSVEMRQLFLYPLYKLLKVIILLRIRVIQLLAPARKNSLGHELLRKLHSISFKHEISKAFPIPSEIRITVQVF